MRQHVASRKDFIGRIEDAGEVKELSNQLKSLAGVLHSLDILAGVLEDDAENATIQIGHIRAGSRVLKEIQARIDKAASKLDGKSRLDFMKQSLKWPFTKSRTKELTEELSHLQTTINLALQADSMNNLLKILTNQSDLKAELSAVREGVKNLQALTRIELDVKRQQTLDFFLKINPQPNLDTSIRLRHPGTGEWLTESPGFREWLETAGSHMWLSGIPGAGKTVLAGAVIQQALDRAADSPKVGVAFFFCDYKNAGASFLENILGTIASQLARQNADAFNALQRLYESLHPSNGLPKEPDADNCRDLVEEMAENFDQVIIVVDGLDECGDNTDDVVGLLSDLAE
ncbi:hypothetical protein DL768_007977 [Monosporascus sp. mg162]|nr:hypothetical protein DL768_007977 [Monosporascus sp. mg162]